MKTIRMMDKITSMLSAALETGLSFSCVDYPYEWNKNAENNQYEPIFFMNPFRYLDTKIRGSFYPYEYKRLVKTGT